MQCNQTVSGVSMRQHHHYYMSTHCLLLYHFLFGSTKYANAEAPWTPTGAPMAVGIPSSEYSRERREETEYDSIRTLRVRLQVL